MTKTTDKRTEFDRKQLNKLSDLVLGPKPKTQKDKDIFNLKHMRYSIMFGSLNYRLGKIATLDRVIKRLEAEKND